MNLHTRITRDPKMLGGKPCIRGMRISVDQILRSLAAGWSVAELLDNYPVLTEEDVQAALAYAADFVAEEGLVSMDAAQ